MGTCIEGGQRKKKVNISIFPLIVCIKIVHNVLMLIFALILAYSGAQVDGLVITNWRFIRINYV